jgi:hypothetical protein
VPGVPFGWLLRDGGLWCSAAFHFLGEAFHRAGVEALLAEVLAGDVDLDLLAGAADGYVGVLLVGLPATDEDAGGLGRDALSFVDVRGIGERQVRERAGVEAYLACSRSWVLIVTLSCSRLVSMIVPVIPFSILFWPGMRYWAEKMTSSPAASL